MNNIQNVDITTASVEELNALVIVLNRITNQVRENRVLELKKYTDGTDGYSQRIANLASQIQRVQEQIQK